MFSCCREQHVDIITVTQKYSLNLTDLLWKTFSSFKKKYYVRLAGAFCFSFIRLVEIRNICSVPHYANLEQIKKSSLSLGTGP